MDPFLGEIRLFAFPRAPNNWVFCNGQMLSVADYNALFALIGTTYGGDGVTNFGVPNMHGCVPIGQGAGTGLTPRALAQTGGAETVTVAITQAPPHTHTYQATTAGDATGTIGPTVTFGGDATGTEKHYLYPIPTNPAPTWKSLADNAVSNQGGGQPHPNIMPGMGLNYCMCANGIWPQNPNS